MHTLFSSSRLVLGLLVAVITYRMFYWGTPFLMDWDTFGQYIYLPLLFDLHQFKFTDIDHFQWIQQEYLQTETLYQFTQLENGNWITRYTLGISLLWLPFYIIAELWATWGDYPTDGFAYPYKVCMAVGTWTYLILALAIFRHLLRKYFSEKRTARVLICTVLGTNLLFTFFATPAISHNFVFLFVCLLVLQTKRYHANKTSWNGLFLGIILGFITLIRVPNILFALIPLLWGATNYSQFFKQFKTYITQHWLSILMAIVGFFILFVWQLLYWRYNSGNWFIDSYANTHGEGLDLFSPYFSKFLFSFRKGWLLYTPIMIFSIWGLYRMWKSGHPAGLAFTVSFALFFWVVSSWTTWWYADSYSQRAMVDFYPVLGIGVGWFLDYLNSSRLRYFWLTILVLAVGLNLFQTYQITHGILHTSRMTKNYYWSVFGQTTPPSTQQRALLLDDPYFMQLSQTIDTTRFSLCYTQSVELNNFYVNDSQPYAPALDINPAEVSTTLHYWLEVTWELEPPQTLEGIIFSACVLHKKQAYQWVGYTVKDDFVHWNPEVNELTYRYVTPNIRHKHDRIRLGFWSTNKNTLEAKRVTIRAFERKDLK